MNQATSYGMPAIGTANLVPCPVCGVLVGSRCVDHNGGVIPFHVERGRAAREMMRVILTLEISNRLLKNVEVQHEIAAATRGDRSQTRYFC